MANLAELLPGILRTGISRERYGCSLLAGGVPKGALTEISGGPGMGKTEVVLSLIAQNSAVRVAWVEGRWNVYPGAFPQHGVSLERVLFAAPGEDCLWTVQQILRSRIFGIVVLDIEVGSEVELRRLQLEAERARAAVVLLADAPRESGTWPLGLQVRVSRRVEGPLALDLLKGGRG